jgi:hypothetical protein
LMPPHLAQQVEIGRVSPPPTIPARTPLSLRPDSVQLGGNERLHRDFILEQHDELCR